MQQVFLSSCRPQIASIARTHIGNKYNEEVWTLLALLSNHITVKNIAFAVDYFEEHCQGESQVNDTSNVSVNLHLSAFGKDIILVWHL